MYDFTEEDLEKIKEKIVGFIKKEGPLFTFLRWFYGKDFEWQYLSLEDAKPYLEFFKDKKTLDWFVFCPKQDNEWDHLYDTYLKRLQSYTNLLFKKDIIALLVCLKYYYFLCQYKLLS